MGDVTDVVFYEFLLLRSRVPTLRHTVQVYLARLDKVVRHIVIVTG